MSSFDRGTRAIQHIHTVGSFSHYCENVTALPDETMGRVLAQQQVRAITGKLEVKFRKPVPLDQELTVVGELVRSRSRAYEARGEIRLPDGTVLVDGTGVYIRIPDEAVKQAKSELDFWEVIPD